MNINLVLQVLWRHKFIITLSCLLGLWLAATAAQRSLTTYESGNQLLLDTQSADLVEAGSDVGDGAGLARTMQLVSTYSHMVLSEPIIIRLEQEFGSLEGESIAAQTVDGAPIIEVTVIGNNHNRVERLVDRVGKNFSQYISDLQDIKGVPPENRITVSALGPPSSAVPLKSRKTETAVLMFLGPLFAGVLLSFAIENIKQHRAESTPEKKPVVPGDETSSLLKCTVRSKKKAKV